MPDFGEPTETLVVESVWAHAHEYGPPTWTEAVETIAVFVPCDPADAETRLLTAVAEGEVRATFDDGDRTFLITLDEETSATVERRWLDTEVNRKEIRWTDG